MTRCPHILGTPIAAVLVAIAMIAPAFSADPITVGNRLELFVDDYFDRRNRGRCPPAVAAAGAERSRVRG